MTSRESIWARVCRCKSRIGNVNSALKARQDRKTTNLFLNPDFLHSILSSQILGIDLALILLNVHHPNLVPIPHDRPDRPLDRVQTLLAQIARHHIPPLPLALLLQHLLGLALYELERTTITAELGSTRLELGPFASGGDDRVFGFREAAGGGEKIWLREDDVRAFSELDRGVDVEVGKGELANGVGDEGGFGIGFGVELSLRQTGGERVKISCNSKGTQR
jgi:hypothetical protein